jgi:hypothetical protein
LAEAVHAALPLFVAGGVPGKVVVNDGVKAVLEVDSFREAIGGDENGFFFMRKEGDFFGAFLAREHAGNRVHAMTCKALAKFLFEVARGRDITTEDDGSKALFEEGFQFYDKAGELGIVRRAVETSCLFEQCFDEF